MSNLSDRLLQIAVQAATDKKAINVVALHLHEISLIADYFMICHGNSDTQVLAIANEIRKQVEAQGVKILGIVLIDLGDVVVHVFHREEREYYHLERLWSDAKTVELV
jgi:ribosome-associated protein